jgi:hypothetical protein
MNKLLIIKIAHTMIWLFFNVVIFYLLYAAITNHINKWVWVGVGLVFLEGLTLLLFKWMCPLTVMARNYSDSTADNFDIFLPQWLARHTKMIYTSLFLIALIILIFRAVTKG